MYSLPPHAASIYDDLFTSVHSHAQLTYAYLFNSLPPQVASFGSNLLNAARPHAASFFTNLNNLVRPHAVSICAYLFLGFTALRFLREFFFLLSGRIPATSSSPSDEPWFHERHSSVYAVGTVLTLTAHVPPLISPRSQHLERVDQHRLGAPARAQVKALVWGSKAGRLLPESWRVFFGRPAFEEAWVSAGTVRSGGMLSCLRKPQQITLLKPLSTGRRPSQLFLVTTAGQELVAKFYDPFHCAAEDAITIHPIHRARASYETEVALYRHMVAHTPPLPVPNFHGSFSTRLSSGRRVYLVLLEYVRGQSLREPPHDPTERRSALAMAIDADRMLLRARVVHGSIAGRNFVKRDTTGDVVVIDFADAEIRLKGEKTSTDLVKRWTDERGLVREGWFPGVDAAEAEAEVKACLKDSAVEVCAAKV